MLTVKHSLNRLKDWIKIHDRPLIRIYYFFKALLLDPKSIGAIYPSSEYLAATMASHIPLSAQGLIVELGAGTGVITEAILKQGVAPERLILIESSADLIKDLREHFAQVKIIEGRAEDLITLLKEQTEPIIAIISSLPLRSLSQASTQRILEQIPQALSEQGIYIPFTYDLRKKNLFYPSNYHLIQSQIVWKNIPPAKVEVYKLL
ncbi:MAG: methyltransferase domain-containing protein [Gammaproteobacteria bacterium]|nr:methyltransferase domain-containing protein [Gammaproteobacteria bacterium]